MSSVLIVDDSPEIRDLCCLMVKRLGYQAFAASNGPEAEGLAITHQPCLILMDIRMPGQDGAETCRRLRARGYTGAITLMSSFREAVGSEQARQCGATSYLAKPIIYNALKILVTYAANQAADAG